MRYTSLAHVLWIGGATDAGKTSVARALVARNGWQPYHYDRYDRLEPPGHWARVDPERHPHMHAALGRSVDESWVRTAPSDMLARWRQTAAERFGLAIEDLRELPTTPPVIAEGYGFLPELVAPLLSSPNQAIWLVPTEEFKLASFDRRVRTGDKGGLWSKTSDPARARANHIGRDLAIGAYITESAAALGLRVVTIDGTQPPEQMAELVEAHFAPHASLLASSSLLAD